MRKSLILLGLLFAVCLSGSADTKKLNQGFLKKAAKQVWNMDLPQFDPKKELTDTIYDGASAANIAVYYYFGADRHEMSTLRDGRIPPKEWRLGETECLFLQRRMVKILAEKGLEENSTFTFEPSETERIDQIMVWDMNVAFGARIFKPDGKVIEVDMKQTLTDGDGKKGKDAVKHKLAIPGLEVGDVLDYFKYLEGYFLGNSGIAQKWLLMSDYPSASFVMEASLDPALTTIVSAFNGVEPPTRFTSKEGKECLSWRHTDLPSFKIPSFCEPERQVPVMNIDISDNISEIYHHPKSRRRPGVFFNPMAQTALPGIAEYYSGRKWEGSDMSKATAIMKSYREANPDASPLDIADASYLTTRYIAGLSKDPFTQWDKAAFMKDLLDKQNIDSVSYLGISNPRRNIDVSYIFQYNHCNPLITVGDRHYFFPQNLAVAPGELPPGYSGETMFKLHGKRKELYENFFFTMDKLPKETAAANTAVFDVRVDLEDAEEGVVNLSYNASRKGQFKSLAGAIVETPDFNEFCEEKLGIPGKVMKKKKIDALKENRFDMAKLEDDQKKKLEQMYEADLGIESMEVDSMIILDFGFDAASPEFRYHLSGKVDDVVAPAGDDIILSIGKLASVVQLTDKERTEKKREISIFTPGASNRRVNLTVSVPEGYTVDSEAIQELAKQSSGGRAGLFMSQVNYDEDNKEIKITLLMRNPSAIYAPAHWDDFRKVREDAASFGEASIVFHRN
ncbi:MAG: DUF3857 domain-containing protein [Muribaculaceae bacterium]|nr:DUF3857 domain-containing protein [Muribaculaceae bacterium]